MDILGGELLNFMIVEVVSNSQTNKTFVENIQTCFNCCTISQLYHFRKKNTPIPKVTSILATGKNLVMKKLF